VYENERLFLCQGKEKSKSHNSGNAGNSSKSEENLEESRWEHIQWVLILLCIPEADHYLWPELVRMGKVLTKLSAID
jgi:hypothetical protein